MAFLVAGWDGIWSFGGGEGVVVEFRRVGDRILVNVWLRWIVGLED